MAEPIATSTIVSQAFRLMELGPISSFADDTPQARDAAEQYILARKICLEASDWSFASLIAALPEVAHDPSEASSGAFTFRYRLPTNCLKVREVMDTYVDWRLDGDFMRANQPGPLSIRFTSDLTNEARLPAKFSQAVSYRLAAMLSPRWVGAANKIQMLEHGAEQTLKDAMRQDARQASSARYDGQDHTTDWLSEILR